MYKKKRDDHPDAWKNKGRKEPLGMGKSGGNFKLKSARVIRQPGDGNCLFHSMAYHLGGTNAGLPNFSFFLPPPSRAFSSI